MKSGIIGCPVSEGEQINSSVLTAERDGEELRRSVRAEPAITTDRKTLVITGTVAIEEIEEYERSEIDDDGAVQSTTGTRKVAKTAEFLQVPGEFVVLERGAPVAMLDILGRVAGTAYERAEVDLDRYLEQVENPSIWMLGFKQHPTNADTGTLYGDGIEQDPIFEEILGGSVCNQLGLEHVWQGDAVDLRLSESGYIEIYSPEYESTEFIDYLSEVILPHLNLPNV